MRRVMGGAVVALGVATLLLAGGMAWLSWMEPHSRGIHPADRGPLAVAAGAGLLVVGGGVAILRGGRPRPDRHEP